MAVNKNSGDLNDMFFVEGKGFEGLSLPAKLVHSARSFLRRNPVAVVAHRIDNHEPIHCCCGRCLKAHLIKKCNENKMTRQKEKVLKLLPCEIGHDGYYKDGARILKN